MGAAIGMAVGGLKPVVEIQFSGFTYSAFNQLANHAARLRNRSCGSLTVPMVLRTPHGGGIRDPDPVVFLEPARIYRSVRQEVPE